MAGFTWNKAGVGAIAAPIANWLGTVGADKAAEYSLQYLGPMPADVHAALYLGISGGLVGLVVYLIPNHPEPPAAPAESSDHA